jgi:hypothetical protein
MRMPRQEVLVLTGAQAQRAAYTVPVVSPVIYAWEAEFIAENLRPADQAELEAGWFLEPYAAIVHCLQSSPRMRAVYRVPCTTLKWEPVMVFGCGHRPEAPDVGVPWLLATDKLEPIGLPLLRYARRVVGMMQRHYPRLENHVHAENARAIRGLKWLGFTLEPAEPWGYKGAPFHRFHWERPAGPMED